MKKPTAQDAPGATRATRGDLRVAVFLGPCPDQEAVDAAGPVDAQTAPTAPWKTADGFPQAPTAIIVVMDPERRQDRTQTRPATGQRQLPSALWSPEVLPLLQPGTGRNSCR
jgi:hypothetical protein